MVRAALEGIAFQVADVLDEAPERPTVLRADGGATGNAFLMQFQADLLGCPVEVARERETTALGAAALAGLATGIWRGEDELRGLVGAGARYDPRPPDEALAASRAAWRDAVARTLLEPPR